MKVSKLLFGGLLGLAVGAFGEDALWRPAAENAAWSSEAWLIDGVLGTFVPGSAARFDGAEENYRAQIPVDANQTLSQLYITGAKDYELTGAGILNVPYVEKSGAGTWTVASRNLDGPANIVVKEGLLKIATNSVDNALGGAGTITIEAGAAVDVGAGSWSNNFDKNEKTHAKRFEIAGDGPDGQGAIVNSFEIKPDDWNSVFGHVHVLADASLGGTHRIDFRPLANSALNAARPKLTGGDDVTLTIRNTALSGIDIHTTDVELGKIAIASGATMMTEGSSTFKLANGLEILDGGILRSWNSTVSGLNASVRTGTGHLQPANGTTTYKNDCSLTIGAGATLVQDVGQMWVNEGAFTVDGLFDVAAGNFIQRGPLSGIGGTVANGGWIWLSGSIPNAGEITPKVSVPKGGILFGDTSGGKGLPRFADLDLTLSGGSVFFVPNASDTIDGGLYGDVIAEQSRQNKDLFFHTLNANAMTTVKNVKTPEETNLHYIYVGAQNALSRYGNVTFAEGTDIVAQDIRTGDGGEKPMATDLRFNEGSNVRLTGWFWNGVWGGVTKHRHDVTVDGGTLDVAGRLYATYDTAYATFTLNRGEVSCETLYVNFRWSGFKKEPYEHKFVQNGGTLKVGKGGILVGTVGGNNGTETVVEHDEYGVPAVVFNRGTLKSTADFGTYHGRAMVFGDSENHDEPFVIENDHLVNWNVGPQGQGDVILRGKGAFNTKADQQAIPFGKWTIEKTAANLRGAAGFAGGLELAPGASAVVKNAAEGCVEFGIVDLRLSDLAANAWADERLPLTTTSLERFQTTAGGCNFHNTYLYRGEFYVSAEQAGTWTFGWCFDDALTFIIDGADVISNDSETYGTAKSVATTLAEGWHRFEIRAWDSHGGFGSNGYAPWKAAQMSLGWCLGAPANALDPASYSKFEPATLPMRPWTGLTWRHKKMGTRSKGVNDTTPRWKLLAADEYTLEERVTSVKALVENNDTSWKNTYLKQSQNELVGWFHVPAEQAGTWTFTQGFDDYMGVMIDGTWVVDNPVFTKQVTADWTAKQGWHSFKIVWGDTYGGQGPNGQSPNIGGVACPIGVKVNGAPMVAFNEDHFAFGYPEVRPGLGGVTTLGAGSLLTSEGVRYPIYGTLKGTGALSGAFAFTGEASCWEVAGSARALTEVANLDGVTDPNPFAGLKQISVRFSDKPVALRYVLSAAHGLSAAEAAAITVKAVYHDDKGREVETPFRAMVEDGNLVLMNLRPSGFTVFLR